MPKRRKLSGEQRTELDALRKRNKDKNAEKRIKALLLHADGEGHGKIAEQTGFAKSYISELVTKYFRQGLSAVDGKNYHGNRRNLSFAEEADLLEPFKKAAGAGQIITVSEIKSAYDAVTGRSVANDRGQITAY